MTWPRSGMSFIALSPFDVYLDQQCTCLDHSPSELGRDVVRMLARASVTARRPVGSFAVGSLSPASGRVIWLTRWCCSSQRQMAGRPLRSLTNAKSSCPKNAGQALHAVRAFVAQGQRHGAAARASAEPSAPALRLFGRWPCLALRLPQPRMNDAHFAYEKPGQPAQFILTNSCWVARQFQISVHHRPFVLSLSKGERPFMVDKLTTNA